MKVKADTIYRQDAINAIYHCTDIDLYVGGVPIMIEKTQAFRALDAVPSAQPEQQWIPCSKRLPKKSGQYYVSGGGKVWICEFLIIPNLTSGWYHDASKPMVQAWVPFPKQPYKENADETN